MAQPPISNRTNPGLSIVIPLHNEEENVAPLLEELGAALAAMGSSYEIICIDDGSTDETFERLRTLAAGDHRLRLLRFGQNYGQTAALSAGFHEARAPVVVTLDGDLQNDPKDIPRLVALLEGGHDIVSGWRRARKDGLLNRTIPSRLANWLISRITGVHLHDYGCTLKAYRRLLLRRFELYGELHRFIPALGAWAGGRVTEVEVSHRPRRRGRSKYGISRTLTVLLDLAVVKFLMSYGAHPIKVFGMAGLLSWALALSSLLAVVVMKVWWFVDMTGNPLLYFAVLGVIVGLQFLLMGVIAEILMRTYHEAQGKRPYVVVEQVN
ncbi:MAG: glycosyltransferase family 2 protein [Acidobacteriota bacterium]